MIACFLFFCQAEIQAAAISIPIFSNRTAGGRKLNRRVEIELKLDV
jgi:outer membrane protein OmpA-like peptidoglycan-associated protein